MSALFVEFISILVDTTMYFNYDLAHNSIMNWWSETFGRLDKHQNLRLELCAKV